MRKIFIDCGAHTGSSVRHFFNTRKDAAEYEIYSFEPDPQHWHHWPVHGVEVIKKAVWIEDKKLPFFVVDSDTTDEGGSTLNSAKAVHNYNKMNGKPGYTFGEIDVETIDLSQFIEEAWTEDWDSYIVLKIDIEGAEYDVIPHLIQTHALALVDELYGEWHNWRCGRCPRPANVKHYKSPEDIALEREIEQKFGLIFTEWDCIDK